MATREKRGWVWTDAEKQWVKNHKRRWLAEHKSVTTQLERFAKSLPMLLKEVSEAARPLVTAFDDLLRLDGRVDGKKYQHMSPEEARDKDDALTSHRKELNAFLGRSDVQQAIGNANKIIRELKRAAHAEKERQLNQLEDLIESPWFDDVVDRHFERILRQTAEYGGLAQGIAQLSLPESHPTVDDKTSERLILVHFVRYTYEFNPERRGAIQTFLAQKLGMKELVRFAIRICLSHGLRTRARDGSLESAQRMGLGPSNEIEILLANAIGGLGGIMKDWLSKGQQPLVIDKKFFAIQGADYSLEAIPE